MLLHFLRYFYWWKISICVQRERTRCASEGLNGSLVCKAGRGKLPALACVRTERTHADSCSARADAPLFISLVLTRGCRRCAHLKFPFFWQRHPNSGHAASDAQRDTVRPGSRTNYRISASLLANWPFVYSKARVLLSCLISTQVIECDTTDVKV